MKDKNRIFGIGSLLSCTFLYGFFAVFSRMMGDSIPLFYQVWIRNLWGALILLVFIIIFKKWQKITKKDFVWMLLRALGGSFAFIGSFLAFLYYPLELPILYFLEVR
jgi:uncharacterized membrane protein